MGLDKNYQLCREVDSLILLLSDGILWLSSTPGLVAVRVLFPVGFMYLFPYLVFQLAVQCVAIASLFISEYLALVSLCPLPLPI